MTPALRCILLQGTRYQAYRNAAIAAARRNSAWLWFGGQPGDLQGFAFQTSTGMAYASGTDQVGLMLDRSYGNNNVGAAIDTYTGIGLGLWTYVEGVVRRNGSTTSAAFSTGQAVAGKTYRSTFTAADFSGSGFRITTGGTVGTTLTANGQYMTHLRAGSNSTGFKPEITAAAAGEVTISDITTQEILGVTAVQATADNRAALLQNAAGYVDLSFDAANDAITINLPSGGTPAVVTFADTGEISGYDSATTTTAVLGQTTLAGKKASLIVASAAALSADDLAIIRRFAGLLRGSAY